MSYPLPSPSLWQGRVEETAEASGMQLMSDPKPRNLPEDSASLPDTLSLFHLPSFPAGRSPRGRDSNSFPRIPKHVPGLHQIGFSL
jgi:hypothetical protein